MTDEELLSRIAISPATMAGKPVVRGTRLTVETILNQLAHGATQQEILDEYEGLSVDDIRACLLYASQVVTKSQIMPLQSEAI